jgi:hypothetical protein
MAYIFGHHGGYCVIKAGGGMVECIGNLLKIYLIQLHDSLEVTVKLVVLLAEVRIVFLRAEQAKC